MARWVLSLSILPCLASGSSARVGCLPVDAESLFQQDVRLHAGEEGAGGAGPRAPEGHALDLAARPGGADPCAHEHESVLHPLMSTMFRARSAEAEENHPEEVFQSFIGNVSLSDVTIMTDLFLEAVTANDSFVEMVYASIRNANEAVTFFLETTNTRVEELSKMSGRKLQAFFREEGAALANMTHELSNAFVAFLESVPKEQLPPPVLQMLNTNMSFFDLVEGVFEDYYSDVVNTVDSSLFCEGVSIMIDNMTTMERVLRLEVMPELSTSGVLPQKIKSRARHEALGRKLSHIMNFVVETSRNLASGMIQTLRREIPVVKAFSQEQHQCSFTGAGSRTGPGLLVLALTYLVLAGA